MSLMGILLLLNVFSFGDIVPSKVKRYKNGIAIFLVIFGLPTTINGYLLLIEKWGG